MSLAAVSTHGLTYTLAQLRAVLGNITSAATPDALMPVAPLAHPSATFRLPVSAIRPAIETRIADIEAELAERRAA